MQLQTILNRVEKQKRVVYSKACFNKKGELEIDIRPRRNSRAICSGCGKKGSTLGYHRFSGLHDATSQLQRMWSNDRTSPLGLWQEPARLLILIVLATRAKRLSWKETANVFYVAGVPEGSSRACLVYNEHF